MKINLSMMVLCSCVFFSLLSVAKHPIKITSSQIRYNQKDNLVEMECKVFIDDFAPAVNETLLLRIIGTNITKDDQLLIENYFKRNYKITINGKPLPLKIDTYAIDNNVMSITFAKKYILLKKGDKIRIENTLLFEAFEDMQSNWITLRIPPFIPSDNFESKLGNAIYSTTF